MPYCLFTDIQSDFKNIVFTATSSVTEAEVVEAIRQESEFIDGMICSVYQTPVLPGPSPKATLILKRIAIFLTSDRVRHILYTKTGTDSKDQDTKGLHSFSRNPNKSLLQIQEGTLKLIDAVELSSNIGFDTGEKCCDPLFDPCKDQW